MGGPEACLAEPPTLAHSSFPPSQVKRQRFLGKLGRFGRDSTTSNKNTKARGKRLKPPPVLNLPFCHSSTRCHVVFAKSAYYTDDITSGFTGVVDHSTSTVSNRLTCVWFREQIPYTSLLFSAQTRMHSITGCLEKGSRRIVWCWTHLLLYHWLQSLAWLLFLVMK